MKMITVSVRKIKRKTMERNEWIGIKWNEIKINKMEWNEIK